MENPLLSSGAGYHHQNRINERRSYSYHIVPFISRRWPMNLQIILEVPRSKRIRVYI